MRLTTRRQTIREEIWIGMGVLAILTLGVFAFNAEHAAVSDDTIVSAGMVTDESPVPVPATEAPAEAPAPVRATHIVARIREIDGASGFSNLISQTDVASMLSTGGPYTVFVPLNAALSLARPADMSAQERERFVRYHVIRDRSIDIAAVRSGNVYAASGDQLNFSVVGTERLERVNSSRIVSEYPASNGIIYIIDTPLFPPQKPAP